MRTLDLLSELTSEVNVLLAERDYVTSTLMHTQSELANVQSTLNAAEARLDDLNTTISKLNQTVSDQALAIATKDSMIAQLQEEILKLKGNTYTEEDQGKVFVGKADEPAYVVIEDWSTGQPVDAGRIELTTLRTANNKMASPTLAMLMGPWHEFTATKIVTLGNFEFHAVRFVGELEKETPRTEIGLYTQPTKDHWPEWPHGAATGKETIAPPFKARVVDINGTQIGSKIEWPEGLPVNCRTITTDPASGERWLAAWRGPRDGNGIPSYANGKQKFYMAFTHARLTIWESRPAEMHDQVTIDRLRPHFAPQNPYAARLSHAFNGLNSSLISSQSNGLNTIYYMERYPMTSAESLNHGCPDPIKGAWSSYRMRTCLEGWGHFPGNNGGKRYNFGEGGQRWDAQMQNEMLALAVKDRESLHLFSNTPHREIAWETQKNYGGDVMFWPGDRNNFTPVHYDNVTTDARFYYHYYGNGRKSAVDIDNGANRYAISSSLIPRAEHRSAHLDSAGNAYAVYGFHLGDYHHDHIIPHWGAVYWRSPIMQRMGEFALRYSTMQQYGSRLFDVNSPWTTPDRTKAWALMQYSMAYMTAAEKSSFTRDKIANRVGKNFHDMWVAHGEGLSSIPATVTKGKTSWYYGMQTFGLCNLSDGNDTTPGLHMFFTGYFAQAMLAAKMSGLWDAVEAYSPEAKAFADCLVKSMTKLMISWWLDAPLLPPNVTTNTTSSTGVVTKNYSDYSFSWLTIDHVAAAGGDPSKLPTAKSCMEGRTNPRVDWDMKPADETSSNKSISGMQLDHFLAIPSWLKFGFDVSNDRLDEVYDLVTERLAEKMAMTSNQTLFFKGQLATFTPITKMPKIG